MKRAVAYRYCRSCGARLARDNVGVCCAPCQTRSTASGPPELPEGFWDADLIRDALLSRHMGRVIASYRQHPFHGQTLRQEAVAGWVLMTQPQLSRVENGPPIRDLDKLILWARTLHIPSFLLWFKLPEDTTRQPVNQLQPLRSDRGVEAWLSPFDSQEDAAVSGTPCQEPAAACPPAPVPLVVAIALVVHNHTVLLVRRRRPEGPLDWQFPAGIVKPCEQPAHVAAAETAAETGIAIGVRERIGSRVHPITAAQCEYFLCEYLHGQPVNRDPQENIDAAWVPLAALDRYIDPALIYTPARDALARGQDT
ncbi:MAG: NUDIX domain-containing protein [Egibacteraceae bacterium]